MISNKLSIGILGGLFDPPHIGHLIFSQWVLEEFKLDKVIFIPAFNPPHKHSYSDFCHRYEMTRRLISNNSRFSVSNIEHHIKGKTYTFRVLSALRRVRSLSSAKFYLIIGADQWQEIRHWKKPEVVLSEAKVIVIPRLGYKIKKILPFYKEILVSKAPFIGVSSTIIRTRAEKGLSIDYLVTPKVLAYIREKQLYVRR